MKFSALFTIAFLLTAYEKTGCYGYPFDRYDPEKYAQQSGMQFKEFCPIGNHPINLSGADDVPLLTAARNLRSTSHPYEYMLAEEGIPAEHDWIPVPMEATVSPPFMYDFPAQHSVEPFYNVQYGNSAEPLQTGKPDSLTQSTTPLPDVPSAPQTVSTAETDGEEASSSVAYSATTGKNIEHNSENLRQSVGDANQLLTKSASDCVDNSDAKPITATERTVVQPAVEGATTPPVIPETTDATAGTVVQQAVEGATTPSVIPETTDDTAGTVVQHAVEGATAPSVIPETTDDTAGTVVQHAVEGATAPSVIPETTDDTAGTVVQHAVEGATAPSVIPETTLAL